LYRDRQRVPYSLWDLAIYHRPPERFSIAGAPPAVHIVMAAGISLLGRVQLPAAFQASGGGGGEAGAGATREDDGESTVHALLEMLGLALAGGPCRLCMARQRLRWAMVVHHRPEESLAPVIVARVGERYLGRSEGGRARLAVTRRDQCEQLAGSMEEGPW
jgi:hypothetical protein